MVPLKKIILGLLTLILIMLDIECKNAHKDVGSPTAYDFTKPEKMIMSEGLQEISGFTFKDLDPSTVYSIQDEDGRLFSQKWGIKKSTYTKFAKKGDYEDLAILGDLMFVLKSNGSLYALPLTEIGKTHADQVKEWKKLMPEGEFESLYADGPASDLILLCKDCAGDKKKYKTTGYILNYDKATGDLKLKDEFTIDVKPIEKLGFKFEHGLRASALSRNPVTKDWYILSAVNKILIVADSVWRVTNVYPLNSRTFHQPEGIAFDNDQNLYISNEGDEITNGNILKFKNLNSPK